MLSNVTIDLDIEILLFLIITCYLCNFSKVVVSREEVLAVLDSFDIEIALLTVVSTYL
jgi:hypothetical protein